MTEYFNKLKRMMKENDIIEMNVWNMNETKFRIECERAHMIITLDSKKPFRMINSNNRDYITFVKCVSSTDEIIPPMLIISGVNIFHKWCQENDLNENTLIEISETKYSNNDLAMDWLQHFIDHTRRRRSDDYILLIIDGFDSHSIIPFFEFVAVNNIVLFRFSAHSTHLIQFLDVGVFQPYKHYHAEAIDTAVRLNDRKFGKLNFLTVYQIFRTQTFKFSTIRHVFRTIGIVLFNSNMVLDIISQRINNKAHAHEPRTFSPQFRLVDITPKSPEFIRRFEEKIKRTLKNIEPNENSLDKKNVDRIQRYVRDIFIVVSTLDLIFRDLDAMQRAFMKRKTRAGLTDTIAAKRKIMKINQCKKLCSIRQKKRKNETKNEAKKKKKE